jgi:hypothetical protein
MIAPDLMVDSFQLFGWTGRKSFREPSRLETSPGKIPVAGIFLVYQTTYAGSIGISSRHFNYRRGVSSNFGYARNSMLPLKLERVDS